jgi:hypothetical protein
MKKPDLTFMGIPIYFDDPAEDEGAVYLVNTDLPPDRKEVLERIFRGMADGDKSTR